MLFSYIRKMTHTYTHSAFLFSSFLRNTHTLSLSFSSQSLSLQFHSRGIETAAGVSSRIDKTMAIARVPRRFSMLLEFYARPRGWYLLTSNHAPKLLLPPLDTPRTFHLQFLKPARIRLLLDRERHPGFSRIIFKCLNVI